MRAKSQGKSALLTLLKVKPFLFQIPKLFLMRMLKEVYHPNAYLVDFRNVKPGLRARTRILNALEKISADAKTVAKHTGLHYGVAMHHLKLLEAKGIVQRKGSRPSVWTLTGLGQKRLQ